MAQKITFVTLGDITSIATMKRALGMANPLHQLGWKVSIIAMDCEANRRRINLECCNDIQIYYYKSGSVGNEISQKTQLVKSIAPDFVYFCSLSARNWIRKSKLGYRPVMIIEHSELFSSIQGLGFARKLKAMLMEYGSVIYASRIICASVFLEKTYKKYATFLFKKNIPVLYSPYAYNDEVINAPKVVLDTLQNKYKGKKVFVYMGTMTRNYGLFTMIQAAEKIRTEQLDFKLLLMGKGRHWEEAKEYVVNKGIEDVVEFVGYVAEEELSSYFELADAFISPVNNTVQDIARCPSKIYMYLPFKKPILTCKVGEPAEIFGENGYYFDNSQPESLAELIGKICSGGKTLSHVNVEEHSWNRRVVDFDKWIKEK